MNPGGGCRFPLTVSTTVTRRPSPRALPPAFPGADLPQASDRQKALCLQGLRVQGPPAFPGADILQASDGQKALCLQGLRVKGPPAYPGADILQASDEQKALCLQGLQVWGPPGTPLSGEAPPAYTSTPQEQQASLSCPEAL